MHIENPGVDDKQGLLLRFIPPPFIVYWSNVDGSSSTLWDFVFAKNVLELSPEF